MKVPCPYCPRSFKRSQGVSAHVRLGHSEVYQEFLRDKGSKWAAPPEVPQAKLPKPVKPGPKKKDEPPVPVKKVAKKAHATNGYDVLSRQDVSEIDRQFRFSHAEQLIKEAHSLLSTKREDLRLQISSLSDLQDELRMVEQQMDIVTEAMRAFEVTTTGVKPQVAVPPLSVSATH